jgi:hypothetical protein
VTFERRFVGKDAEGRALAVPVRVILDPSVGKRTRPIPAVGSLPAARAIRPDDLGSLAGRWRGSYRVQNFDVPLEVTIRENGSFEAAENDPVTNRFGGTFRVEDGKLAFTQRNDTGTVTLHEGGDRRILAGQIRGSRGSPPAAVSYAIRLEAEPQ